MLNYLLDYWNLFEFNNWSELLAISAVPSAIFLIATTLLVKIIHMHIHKDRRVMNSMLNRLREEIRLHEEYVASKNRTANLEELRRKQTERDITLAQHRASIYNVNTTKGIVQHKNKAQAEAAAGGVLSDNKIVE